MSQQRKCIDCGQIILDDNSSRRKRCLECVDLELERRQHKREEERRRASRERGEIPTHCGECGCPIEQSPLGGRRQFCSDCAEKRRSRQTRDHAAKNYRRYSKKRDHIDVDKALAVIRSRRPAVSYGSMVGYSNIPADSDEGAAMARRGHCCTEKFERMLSLILSGKRQYIPMAACVLKEDADG